VTVVARRRRWVGVALVLAMFLAGVSGSWAVTVEVQRVQDRHAAQLMDQYAHDISRAVVDETDRYHDTLTDLAAAVGAQSDLTAGDFAQITSGLKRQRLPGASSAVFAVPAADVQIPAVQAFWRAQGATGLRLAPVGTGLEHMFVVFSRPLDGVPPVYGRDMSQRAEPAKALRMSRDSGQLAASRTYVLLTDRNLPPSQQQLSFLLAASVHGGVGTPDVGRFRGWVFMSMRGGDFLAETLLTQSHGAVGVNLVDISEGEDTPVVMSSGGTPQADSLDRDRSVTVGQRTWQLRMHPTDSLLTATDRRMPGMVLGIGTLITLLLTALVGVLAGTRNRAMTKVDQATAALRHDIERRKKTEARLRERDAELQHLAFHDPLTGLANRALFYQRVEHALVTHNRSGSTLAVLFVDLDGFKQVNDERGHGAGDFVLAEVAVRLRRCVRASDTVARLGGDEFAVLAELMTAPEHAEVVADHIVRALQAPFDISGESVTVTASVGVVFRRPGASAADDLLRSADEAMYAAKVSGKDRYCLVGATTHEQSAGNRRTATALP
jgi:diguanylate cyclase (GGDEF)-like protein